MTKYFLSAILLTFCSRCDADVNTCAGVACDIKSGNNITTYADEVAVLQVKIKKTTENMTQDLKPMVGAVVGGAEDFPNIHLATYGYHLFEGDPMPILGSSEPVVPYMTKMDPGLKKPLFEIKYSKGRLTSDMRHTQPDGYHATVDYGCSTVFTTKKIRDVNEYMNDQSSKVSAYARAEAAIKFPPSPATKSLGKSGVTVGVSGKAFARVGGSLSVQFKTMQQDKSFRDSEMYRTEAKCNAYVAAFSFAFPPETHPDFKKTIGGLGSISDSLWWLMFDEYGTHFLTTIRMGARYGSTMFVDKRHSSEMTKTAHGLGLNFQAAVGAVAKVGVKFKGKDAGLKVAKQAKLNVPLLSPKEKVAAKEMNQKYVSKSTFSIVGPALPEEGVPYWLPQVLKSPVPYSFDHEVICDHPEIASSASSYKACVKAMNSYCDGHLKAKGASCEPAKEKGCYNDLDCEEDNVCRGWECVKVPICKVSIFSGKWYGGDTYTLDAVTNLKNFDGKKFSLRQAGWYDRIRSFRMSEGCEKIKLYDDYDWTEGRNDAEYYSANNYQVGYLGNDLDKDVIDIKVWAKKVPADFDKDVYDEHKDKYLSDYTSFGGTSIDLSQALQECVEVSDCKGITCDKSDMCTLRGGWDLHGSPSGETTYRIMDREPPASTYTWGYGPYGYYWAEIGSSISQHNEPQAAEVGVEQLTDEDAGELDAQFNQIKATDSERRLGQETDYLKNIGKALYGYNAFFGEPSSSNFAGTDPGWQHRPVWGTSYDQGNVVQMKDFHSIPRPEGCIPEAPPEEYYQMSKDTVCPESDLIATKEECEKAIDFLGLFRYHPWANNYDGVPKGCSFGNGNNDMHFNSAPSGNARYDLAPICKGSTKATDTCSSAGEVSYKKVTSGKCDDYVTNMDECGLAAAKIGLQDTSPEDDWQSGVSYDPPYCYFEWGQLKFNKNGKNSGSCSSSDECVCKDKATSTGTSTQKTGVLGTCCTIVNDYGLNPGVSWGMTPSSQQTIWGQNSCDGVVGGTGAPKCKALLLETERSSSKLAYGPARTQEELQGLKVPDGWTVTKATKTVCDTDFKTKEIKSQYAYQHEAKDSFNLLGGRLDFGFASFSMSSESTEFRKANSENKKAQYQTTAECFEYVAEITDLKGNPPPTSSNFQYVVDSIEEPAHWYKTFDLYGLHFPDKLLFGAKYGFTQNIEEFNYETLSKNTKKFSMGAEVTKGIKKKKGIPGGDSLAFSASIGASYGTESSQSELEKFESFFSDQREFSLGRRMPFGGAAEWVNLVEGESMPFRYSFESICEHPALAGKKADCEKYTKLYCTEHLVKSGENVVCDPAEKAQCLWDIDCPQFHECVEGQCVKEPECLVKIYSGTNLNGHERVYGPVFYSATPDREPFGVGGSIDSAWISGGCSEVIFMDEDKCQITYSDNKVVTNKLDNEPKEVSNFNYDLENDVCKVKLTAKKKWIAPKLR